MLKENITLQEIFDTFNQLYLSKGKYITNEEACKELGACQKTLRKKILELGGYDNCPDVFLHIQKPIHVFDKDKINNEAAYWLGYLMADGCYTHTSSSNTNFRLMLECKIADKEILEKFCDFIGVRKERITIGHNGASVALSMTDNVYTTSVSEYGIVYNKSHLDHVIPEIIKNNEEFLFQYFKGLVDGDGTIHTAYGSPGVSIVDNSKSFLEELKTELEKYLPEPNSIWIMEKTIEQQKDRNATQSLFILKIGSGINKHSNMTYLYNKFYSNDKIILRRKEQLLKSLLIE